MNPDDELRSPQRRPTQCQVLPARAPGQGHGIAILACLVLLLLPSAALSAPRNLTATVERGGGSGSAMTLTATGAPLLPRLGVYAQATAYAADSGKPDRKGAREFFQEFLDLFLKVLVSIGFIANILAAVKLWLDERAAKRRRKELRICPHCYNPIRRRKATRCPHCRIALAPEARIATAPPRPEPDRYGTAREEPLRGSQPQQPVRVEPVREDRRTMREVEAPMREGPVRREAAPKEGLPVGPTREVPLLAGLEEREGEECEEDDWEDEDWEDEWELESPARRRKEFVYAFVFANLFFWLAVALLYLLFGRL